MMGIEPVPLPFSVLAIEPGLMRFTLDILENQIRKSKTGSPSDNWVSIGQIRGMILPVTMAEFFRSGATGLEQVYHLASHRIHTRFSPLVDTSKRLSYYDSVLGKNRVFILVSVVDVDNRHTQLVCLVKEEIYSNANAGYAR